MAKISTARIWANPSATAHRFAQSRYQGIVISRGGKDELWRRNWRSHRQWGGRQGCCPSSPEHELTLSFGARFTLAYLPKLDILTVLHIFQKL
jgi:hypothetical protein